MEVLNVTEADRATSPRYRYRAWDDTQSVPAILPADLLAALADDLLSGSIDQALDKALHRGVASGDLEALGLDELRELLRRQRRELLDAIAADPELQRLVDQLQQGGAQSLDADLSRLLDALTANAATSARMISGLDADQRFPLDAALRERLADAGRHLDSDDINLSMGGASQGLLTQIAHLSALDDLEKQVRSVRRVDDVDLIDEQLVRHALGDRAADGFTRLAVSLQTFSDSGYLRGKPGKRQLSARAIRLISDELLARTLERISAHRSGDRAARGVAGQHDLTGASRPYEFGDALTLDLGATVMSAVRRGGGSPVRLRADDFTVFEREESSRAATMLAIDLSRSMGERGYLLAAKQLALGLTSLVRQRYPRDELLLAGFSDTARQLQLSELPALGWDRYGMGTNIQDALRLARTALATHRGMQRTLILLTDGEPTAHRDLEGRVHFHQPPGPEALTATYAEAHRLRRDGIDLVVCVLSRHFQVVRFAEELAHRAGGDLIVTSPDDLAEALTLRFGRRR
ncbi:MAG TPA: hypothetical protein DEU95_07660 [Chloroflexi bacterium]|jgi:uncharacterized protein with von Willebrand factor type A (vWA) domain|nr:hypothetical protein [Chloroflexota bacterium]